MKVKVDDLELETERSRGLETERPDNVSAAPDPNGTEDKESPSKPIKIPLSESFLLKAENHRLKMINQMLQDDNYKMKRAAQGQQLREQQSALELEFATECGTEDKFDWNTLKFIPR